jgi:hypothetical protein
MKTSATYISTKNIYFNLRCIYFELGNLLKAISFITSIFLWDCMKALGNF